jgi:hypothetical protein
MKPLIAAAALLSVVLLPSDAQAHWGVTWNLSIRHGDAVLGENVRRDLDTQTMTVTIQPGHAAVFTIELSRGKGEQPRLSTVITGCVDGGWFGARWFTERGANVTSSVADNGYETPKLGGGQATSLRLVIRASAASAGNTKECHIAAGGVRGDKVLILVRSHR